jgi:hypothetical protein
MDILILSCRCRSYSVCLGVLHVLSLLVVGGCIMISGAFHRRWFALAIFWATGFGGSISTEAEYTPGAFSSCGDLGVDGILPISIGQSEAIDRQAIEDTVRLAVYYVNTNEALLPKGIKLVFHNASIPLTADGNPTPRTAGIDACTQIERHNAIAILGGSTSAHEAILNHVAKEAGVAELSYSATSPSIPSNAMPHYFLRTVPSDLAQGVGMLGLLSRFNWP